MDRHKLKTPDAYGRRAQEGVLQVFMSLICDENFYFVQ